MKAPTTKAEFEKMLIAFQDNAEVLLGDDAMYEVCSVISAQEKDGSLNWKLVDGVMSYLFKGLDASADEIAKNIRAGFDKLRGQQLEDIIGKL